MCSFRGAHGERVECEPITGVQGTSGGQGSGGEAPTEAESFLALGRATDRANLYPLQYFHQSITTLWILVGGQNFPRGPAPLTAPYPPALPTGPSELM